MKKFIILISFIFSSTLFAAARDISAFALSLEKMIGLKRQQFEEIADNISIKYSTRMNPNATATYTPLLKKITFNPELSISVGNQKRVRTMEELEQSVGHIAPVHAATIFHEFAHAELDTVLSKGRTNADVITYQLVTKTIKPWFQKHFPKFNSQYSMHEFYAYYRTDYMETMFNDMSDLLLYNGWNQYQKRCFAGPKIKELRKKLTKEEFVQFLIPDDAMAMTHYRDRVKVQYVYVNGKEFDMTTVKSDPFKQSWYHQLYKYLEDEYGAFENRAEFAAFLKVNFKDLKLLKDCREKLWETLPAQ